MPRYLRSGSRERDKIGSLVLRKHDQVFFFLMPFIVSGIIKIPHYLITDPQPGIAEGIILI